MSALTVNIKGLDKVLKNLGDQGKQIAEEIDIEMTASAVNIANLAVNKAPVNFGQLRVSISSKFDQFLYKEVNVNADYAPYVEFGTKSNFDNSIDPELKRYAATFKGSRKGSGKLKDAIYKWASKKGIEKKYWGIIYLRILKFGSKPHPFLFPSFDYERPKLLERIKKVVNEKRG